MTQAVARILADVEQLSADERADLTDHLVENSAHQVASDLEQARLAEVRRRIARVEAGESPLIPGEQVFAQGRALLASLYAQKQAR